ncbi:MAG: BlaI/MecI/CopY family transcriptional regulator [Planctomycetaceae bacterium]
MSRDLPPLSDTQLEIMNLIWQRGEASVSDVWKALAERRPVARNTIHTLIVRLEEKGWLTHREDAGFLYAATVSQEDAQRQTVQRLIDTVFAGSAEELVLTLLASGAVSRPELERIRKQIETAKRKPS